MKIEPELDFKLREEFDKDVKSCAFKLLVYTSLLKANKTAKPPIDNIKDILDAYIEMGVRDLTSKRLPKSRAKILSKTIFKNRLNYVMEGINS